MSFPHVISSVIPRCKSNGSVKESYDPDNVFQHVISTVIAWCEIFHGLRHYICTEHLVYLTTSTFREFSAMGCFFYVD